MTAVIQNDMLYIEGLKTLHKKSLYIKDIEFKDSKLAADLAGLYSNRCKYRN